MTQTHNTQTTGGDLVPIADRLRYMQAFRVIVVLVSALVAWGSRDSLDAPAGTAAAVLGAYTALAVASHVAWRLSRRGGLALFGIVLILDGLFLGYATYATGGPASPLRFLIILHVIAVALLASYRTGMKVAAWHSLLLLVVHYAQQAKLLTPYSSGDMAGTPFQQLAGFSAVLWFAAIATSHFSAVNERELRRRRYDMEALAAMAESLELTRGSRSAASVLVESAADAFDIDRALVLAAPPGKNLTVLGSKGDIGKEKGKGDAEIGRYSIVSEVMTSRRTQLVGGLDPQVEPLLASLLPGARNLVVVPLSSEGHSIGVLIVEHTVRGSRIERRIVGMLERFAAYGALALRNAWLLEQVQGMAVTDALTGLANRGALQDSFAREVSRAIRDQRVLSFLMLDVDHFKAVNDVHGHQAGDVVLQRVARQLDENVRAGDLPGRWGGEEFAVLLPDTEIVDALQVAERMRAAIGRDESDPRVTVSVGVATFPQHGEDMEQLVRSADEALYASKRDGRDRVSVAVVPGLEDPPPAELL